MTDSGAAGAHEPVKVASMADASAETREATARDAAPELYFNENTQNDDENLGEAGFAVVIAVSELTSAEP